METAKFLFLKIWKDLNLIYGKKSCSLCSELGMLFLCDVSEKLNLSSQYKNRKLEHPADCLIVLCHSIYPNRILRIKAMLRARNQFNVANNPHF